MQAGRANCTGNDLLLEEQQRIGSRLPMARRESTFQRPKRLTPMSISPQITTRMAFDICRQVSSASKRATFADIVVYSCTLSRAELGAGCTAGGISSAPLGRLAVQRPC